MSRVSVIALALGLAVSSLALTASAATVPSPAITAAVADSNRPQADKDRDADRKPAEMLAFAGVKAGDKVVDFMPGAGYFTRLFAKAVGPKGRVYSLLPNEIATRSQKAVDGQKALAGDKAYGNIVPLVEPVNALTFPEKVDVVWTSQNYHDVHAFMGAEAAAAVNKAIFNALKPGGVYIVLDHAAEAGSGVRDTNTLHRIDPETVKKEVEAAGFVLEGQDDALHNTADNHTLKVFDPALRGHTDQFVFKFRKPK
ncbi:methyltransferase [Nitrospirillum sp. BR 11163]|uniref:class I SAM-dependent methyltransferase n=1 Tax=Nitrospirillum sp. BR 11163 TaxID=3104323 RepID=UPI002AFFF04B|nr:methyltransferase [Nitrospirillum sp. BR 11163]MEA1676744.1 methyltransferase domain-containing protein [Nitrospirillum sp. BR 11163]